MAEVDDEENLTDRQRSYDFIAFSGSCEDVGGYFEHNRHWFDEMLGKDAVGNGNLGQVATHGIAPRLKRNRRAGEAKLLTRRRGVCGLR
jgi:hypothetical protein